MFYVIRYYTGCKIHYYGRYNDIRAECMDIIIINNYCTEMDIDFNAHNLATASNYNEMIITSLVPPLYMYRIMVKVILCM